LKNAFEQRIYADYLVGYNFYINNMPKHDLNHLDHKQEKRIEALVKNTKTLKRVDLGAYL